MKETQDVTEGTDSHVINIGLHGRIVIPASIRKSLGLKPGDKVVSWIEDNKLIIKPSSLVEKELWAIFKKSNLFFRLFLVYWHLLYNQFSYYAYFDNSIVLCNQGRSS